MLSHQSCWNVFSADAHFKPLKDHDFAVVGIVILLSSVSQSRPTVCNPIDCSTAGFPVHHQLPELAQTHVHWVGDAIQPSYPLSSPAFNLPSSRSFPVSQFFASGKQSIGASASASVLPMNIQDWFPLGLTGLISLLIFPSKLVIVNKIMKSVKKSSHVRIK